MTFRTKMLLFGCAVAGLTAVAVFAGAGRLIRHSVEERIAERLHAEAGVVAVLWARDPALSGSTPDTLADLAGRALRLRVTLIAPDGRVLGDSDVPAEALAAVENHGTRPEVVQALGGAVGADQRTSATVGTPMSYVARRAERDGVVLGVVRLSVPLAEIRRSTAGYGLRLSLVTLGVLLGVAAVGYVAARRFSRPLERMSAIADAIAAGERQAVVEYESADEIGHLGAALNRMTRALAERIEELTAEKRLRDTLLEGMSEGLLIVDRDRRVLLGNGALRTCLRLGPGDPLAGRRLIELVREPAVVDAFDATIERGEWRRENVRIGGSAGAVFELTVAPLVAPDGARTGALGLLVDITRLTALEVVRREFVADVSHELRTPLTSIKAYVETLLAGGLDDPQHDRRFLEIVQKHADRMEAILEDLTDLSLIETGAVSLERETLELARVARDVVESLRPRAAAHDVRVELEVPAGLTALADRRRLEQVLVNLVENAIKFNRPGGTVTLRAAALDPGVRIEVEDSGIGIPAAALERIFNRFYRVDRGRSRELGGTGLGLSIVKHLVRLHGGTVSAESELGRGSRFIVELPG